MFSNQYTYKLMLMFAKRELCIYKKYNSYWTDVNDRIFQITLLKHVLYSNIPPPLSHYNHTKLIMIARKYFLLLEDYTSRNP